MDSLNLPTYSFNIKSQGEDNFIFDAIRKKFICLTPEEWVRQNFIRFLIEEKEYPPGLTGVEISLQLNNLNKRCDILFYSKCGEPLLVVECKAPGVKIDQKVFDQIARYNIILKVSYLIVTNGMKHYCCKFFPEEGRYVFLQEIPKYTEL